MATVITIGEVGCFSRSVFLKNSAVGRHKIIQEFLVEQNLMTAEFFKNSDRISNRLEKLPQFFIKILGTTMLRVEFCSHFLKNSAVICIVQGCDNLAEIKQMNSEFFKNLDEEFCSYLHILEITFDQKSSWQFCSNFCRILWSSIFCKDVTIICWKIILIIKTADFA